MKKVLLLVIFGASAAVSMLFAQDEARVSAVAEAPAVPPAAVEAPAKASLEYTVGVDDVLEINVLQPEKFAVTVTVAPDGAVTFPYIGTVMVKGITLAKVQEEVQAKLADGYMKYPVVSVLLKESRSKKFFVYGEVGRPGTYLLDDNTTILKAISTAGGFTKYGSSSRVKVLRPKENQAGSEVIKVKISAVMNGDPNADVVLKPGDTVVVSEGVF